MTRFRVLIVSYAHWEGLSRLPALLHRAGCEVSVLGVQDNFPSLSVHVRRTYVSPDDVNAVIADLKVHLESQPLRYDWIIIGDDPLLYALAQRRNEAWVQQCFPCRLEAASVVVSKADFLQACTAAQIPVPSWHLCHSGAELEQAAAECGFPLVIKETQGFAGLAVKIVQNPAQLAGTQVTTPLIVQRFVPGRLGSAAVLFRYGKPLAWFSYYRERTWGALGPSSAIRWQTFPEMEDILHKLGDISGFHGVCGIDFIQEASTGKLVLLEQNFRPTLTVHLGRQVGVDFARAIPGLMDIEALGHLPVLHQQPDKHSLVALFPQDAFRALDESDHRGLLKWLCLPWWWPELRLGEPRIFLTNMKHIFRKIRAQKTQTRNGKPVNP